MKVLVVGRGGREAALVWKLSKSPHVKKIYCATGNAGMEKLAERVNIKAEDIDELLKFCKKKQIDMVTVGPEVALTRGIVDVFQKEKIPIFGPGKAASELESSKAFAKQLMGKYDIPTARFGVFSDQEEAFEYLQEYSPPFAIKADGMDSGKGLIIAKDEITARLAVNIILKDRIFGDAGNTIIIEELLSGEEVCVVAFTDGKRVLSATTVKIYKRAYDGDRGPFTGGMGAMSPDPRINKKIERQIMKEILTPTVEAMAEEGRELKGVFCMHMILTADGPKVVEFNVRFNDPATQVILPRLKTDLFEIMQAITSGDSSNLNIEWDERTSLMVVAVSGGYPMKYTTGQTITGLESLEEREDLFYLHAGTSFQTGNYVTAGGRVLNFIGLGEDREKLKKAVYSQVEKVYFRDIHFRRDIGDLEKKGR